MIKLTQEGDYKLIETKGQTKILTLDSQKVYAWITAKDIGEILETSHVQHKVDHILAIGEYRIYDVKNEPQLSDQLHLELSVGRGMWQGYLLLTGLPSDTKKRSRIIPTSEIISESLDEENENHPYDLDDD
jgi:hypothetical protein